MENLITTTNKKLEGIILDLLNLKNDYEEQIKNTDIQIDEEYKIANKYREEFNESKKKIEKMTNDINGFEEDYKNLVEKFADDELSNILVAANKEITSKIDERKKNILKDKKAMNNLVSKAKIVKKKLVKLNALKLELKTTLEEITKAYNFYNMMLNNVIIESDNIDANITEENNTIELGYEVNDFDINENKINFENEDIEETDTNSINKEEKEDDFEEENTSDEFESEDNLDIDQELDFDSEIEQEENDLNLEEILSFDDSLEE